MFSTLLGGFVSWGFHDYQHKGTHELPVATILNRDPEMDAVAALTKNALETEGAQRAPIEGNSVNQLHKISKLDEQGSVLWRPVLSALWCAGVLIMVLRLSIAIGGSRKLLREVKPLEDPRWDQVLSELSRTFRVIETVRLRISDRLVSPVVLGWLTPVLVLPANLFTTLTVEQIRMVLCHELAHIQRRDYLINLFQMLVEALLFFNPAVWWLSKLARLEREIACDEMATGGKTDRVSYARALLAVAQSMSDTKVLDATMAFAEKGRFSGLRCRIERLLLPASSRIPHLSIAGIFGAMLLSLAVLSGAALGTKATVNAVLSHEQRIDRIQRVVESKGESAQSERTDPESDQIQDVQISGRIVISDGQSVPNNVSATVFTRRKSYSGTSALNITSEGVFSGKVLPGKVVICINHDSFAPAIHGPFELSPTSHATNLVIQLNRGTNWSVVLVDANSGAPLKSAELSTRFWMPEMNSTHFPTVPLITDGSGRATLEKVSNLPMTLVVRAKGYELADFRIEKPLDQNPVILNVRPGESLAGVIREKGSGKPLEGAVVRILYETSDKGSQFDWFDPIRVIATTDAAGKFESQMLSRGAAYWIGVSHPKHESFVWERISGSRRDLVAELGPELVVKGRILGDLKSLRPIDRGVGISVRTVYKLGPYDRSDSVELPVSIDRDTGYFAFTNLVGGPVTIQAGDTSEERLINSPTEDWVIQLKPRAENKETMVKLRRVRIRFVHPSRVKLQGNVELTSVYKPEGPQHMYRTKAIALEQGEAIFDVPVTTWFEVRPTKTTFGFWFEPINEHSVPESADELVKDITVIPAGVITAQAVDYEGKAMSDVSFSVHVISHSSLLSKPISHLSHGDSWDANSNPRTYISGPIPLDGRYVVVAWQRNGFAVSDVIHLTDRLPDPNINLKFPPPSVIEGIVIDETGKPVPGIEVVPSWSLKDRGYGLKPVYTADSGKFLVEGVTPQHGIYSLTVSPRARWRGKIVQLIKPSTVPLRIQLEPGKTMVGKVVQFRTDKPVISTKVRARPIRGEFPEASVLTDDTGRFEFTNLGEAECYLHVENASSSTGEMFKATAGRNAENLVLRVVAHGGTQLRLGSVSQP